MTKHRDWSRPPRSLALALAVAIATSLLFLGGVFDSVEDALTSKRAELLERSPTGQTVIVEIDARSLATLRDWPWPRRYHAQLLRQLHEAGASIIAFDVDFSARSNDGDAALASAIADAGHVILPTFAQKASASRGGSAVLSSRPDAAFGAAWVGGVNIYADPDGVVREYPAATFIDGAVQPAIATLLAEKNGLGDRTFRPDWAINAGSIPRFSFVDVMNGRIPAGALKGKRVLIGATAVELGDRYAVPRYGVLPGVVIQALASESMLQDRAVQATGSSVTLAGILALALLLVPRALKRPARYAILCAALLGIVAVLPVAAQWLWPVSIDSAAWIFTAIAAFGVQAAVEAKRRLLQRAHFDADSGLPNRSLLEQSLAMRPGGQVLVCAAIDRFEPIRDAIGLDNANAMVRACADRVASLGARTVYRIAPDVIAWVHPDAATVAAALRQVQLEFRQPVGTSWGPVDVALTVGLENDDDASAPVLCIEHALSAIGNARLLGKNHAWHRTSEIRNRRHLSMMGELRQAMNQGDLRLAYQPKMALASGTTTDCEALIRWVDGGQLISPDEFIPLAEATGVICEITAFALRTALADLGRWARSGLAMRVAVNISALDLATDGFADKVSQLIAKAGVPPSQLTLEVTESALLRSPEEAIATLAELRAGGVRLAIDDYGTGQSTLSYLKHLPVHELKIDKSFVTSLIANKSDQIMVRSTINLAHELGLEVVAEGIEDRSTFDMLAQFGCDYGQGYFIRRPVFAEQLAAQGSTSTDRRVA